MKRSKQTAILIVLLLPAISLGSSLLKMAWQQKPYPQWDMSEVEKFLTDSPWAQTRQKGVVLGVDNPVGVSTAPESVVLRLRSGLPMRQVLARLRQLKGKYDTLGDKEKRSFDEKNKILIECPACADNYVVSLAPANGQKGVPAILQTMAEAEVKLNVHLTNETGETRPLVHFAAPKKQGDEAVFFFARFNDKGEPLITPNSRKLLVTFDTKIFPTVPLKFEFAVPKMMIDGAVAF